MARFAWIMQATALVLLSLLSQPGHAEPSPSTEEACQAIAEALPDRLAFPLSPRYHSETRKYWSRALREIKPACIASPRTAEDVAAIVKILNEHEGVPFAVKSGGHDPNPGHGSVQDGVLIAMRDISGADYDAEKKVAHVRPGGEWTDVVEDLEDYGVTVLGGRLGIVGIGGYLLQGGISFLSAQRGLASDTIRSWETVLPNGTIAQIDAAEHPDLAVAMRGGGGQFGIVTKFTMEAHPIGKVWGGTRLYDVDSADELFRAMHDFVPGNPDNGRSAIIFTKLDLVGGKTMIMVFLFYDGPTPPTTGPFADFLAIPSKTDDTSTQSYAKLLKSNGVAADILEARISFRTHTIPYIKSHPEMYSEIAAKWQEVTSPHLGDKTHLTSQCSVDFQPFPATIGEQSQRRGGNAMGISGDDGDRLLLELQCSWARRKDDDTLYALSRNMTDWLDSKLPEWLADEPAHHGYLPYLMNDAMGDQNVTGMYRDYAKFKALQEEVDPEGLFSTRAGGYKF